ncbi:MAG: glycosyltransferase family 4 protein [Candidatus Eremiobacterales bacterium]|jgi:glycosyltransferase involved in cell wall biosynthesis
MIVRSYDNVTIRAAENGSAHPRVLFLGSYPPRECGIATFVEDVRDAYDAMTGLVSDVIAMNDTGELYRYPSCVVGTIDRDDLESYSRAARSANASSADVVNIQHEYGLFGGERGSHLLEFLRDLHRPVVLTLHTTLPDPDEATLRVTRELCHRADRVMVLTEASKTILTARYGVRPSKVCVVMHGVPDVAPVRGPRWKRPFGLEHDTVLSTFGLLSRGKGIETIIDAMPAIVERHPDAHYVLWGQTHPSVKRHEGERYRTSLLERAQALGVIDRVSFVNRYMTDDEVVGALLATDVYVSTSLDPHQSVSGTLSYAVACGRAVIATEYLYAKELLADGRGITVPFRDPRALAATVDDVLRNPSLRASLESAAYRFGRRMTWPRIAAGYREAFADSLLAGLDIAAASLGA